ncbi:MAG: DUF1045 domain-containing protein [Chloroflexota bacterium]
MAQLGVFLIPPADHPFYQITTRILGYDVWAERTLESSLAGALDPETLATWLDFAPTFGIHCTIGGAALAYDDADRPEIEARLAWIASRTAPFTLVNGRFYDDFHARPKALVTTFDSPDGALQRLHRQVVTVVSPLYVSSNYAPQLPQLDERKRELYYRTGEPWVLEHFEPHWTLMSGLPDEAAYVHARDLIGERTGLFADASTSALHVTDVQLVERPARGGSRVVASFPFMGG